MAQVYFKSSSTPFAKDALHLSIKKLMEKISTIEKGDIVAIKLHMGELGNIGYIRPIFVRRVVDFVKEQGGKPFITDTTTLYGGHRGNAIDYLMAAAINGFSISSMGCPIIIADGLLGKDEEIIGVDGYKIAVAKAIAEADYLVTLSHFKGHGMAGFGGAIKNLGMGCCSKAGKTWQHEKSKPLYDESKCIFCRKCLTFCPADAIYEENGKIKIDYEKCKGCGACTVLCEKGCFYLTNDIAREFQKRVAIAAKAAMKKFNGKASFINFLLDITPRCDCCSFADKPLINDIGILASSDAVAIDQASYDLVCKEAGKDIFYELHGIDGTVQINEGEKLGLGSRKYELIEI
ncbi:MAG: 4Fe-4S ferredoxin [Thermoplasmata archaeon]|nr:MAG: 4Fe-4S ferredoxin [Thermoplasmata archaeon]HDN96157.1 DUF362 domain-containing protein [Thermoplasmatales archaeon]